MVTYFIARTVSELNIIDNFVLMFDKHKCSLCETRDGNSLSRFGTSQNTYEVYASLFACQNCVS